ncbi:MAG TPA: hypothetical protein VGU71_16890 [Candidatus Dormibacteraeota bacterium]|nr:hypothetical protein [Candidatus Dormibacteraeota bacterium]
MSGPATSRLAFRHPLIVAYLLALIPAIACALLQPVWSLVDESDHYDLVAQYAHGVYPHFASRPTIRPETLRITESSGTFGYVPAGTVPRPILGPTFDVEPAGLDSAQHNLWVERHFWQFSKQAWQAPLFYIVAIPVFELGDAASGAMGALVALRLFNALLAALLAPLAYVLSLRLWPRARWAAVGTAALTAVLAGPVLDFTHVTNDTLAAVLVGACLVVATGQAQGIEKGVMTPRRACVLGLLFGAACLTRVPDAAIAPALLIPLLRAKRMSQLTPLSPTPPPGGGRVLTKDRRITNTALCFGVAAAIVSPWLLLNLTRFGSLTQLNAVTAWWPVAPPTDPGFLAFSTLKMVSTFLVDVPYGVAPSAPWLIVALSASVALGVIGAVLAVFAAVGLWRAARNRESTISRPTLAILATATAGITLAAVLTPLLEHLGILVPGRYLYPALPAISALLVTGLAVELKPAPTRGAIAVLAVLSIVVLAVFLAQPMSGPQGPGRPVNALPQARSDQGSFGPLIVSAISCARDPSTGVWVEVTALNTGSGPLDWMPAPIVSARGTVLATSDYRRSTQLPGTLEAGESVTGWLWLGDRRTLSGTETVTLTFPGVALDAYHRIGDLKLTAHLC